MSGAHNQSNAAAAIQAVRCIGGSPEGVQSGLDTFAGLRHRLGRVRMRNGVEWVNDSKATNVDSAATALRAFDHGVVWIAGGEGKGTSYRLLAELTPGRVKAVLGIGKEGPVILAAVGASVVENVVTLDVAVGRADALAVAGDAVRLAPARAPSDRAGEGARAPRRCCFATTSRCRRSPRLLAHADSSTTRTRRT